MYTRVYALAHINRLQIYHFFLTYTNNCVIFFYFFCIFEIFFVLLQSFGPSAYGGTEYMKRILFLCHGNICRSPMAEFIFLHLCREAGVADNFEVASAAISTEETGNDIYPPAQRILREHGIPFTHRNARQVAAADFDYYDHVICADRANIRLLPHYTGIQPEMYSNKVSLLMSWAGENRDVSDPWYTRDFETAYRDIYEGCNGLLSKL